jgi:hypothetical protein
MTVLENDPLVNATVSGSGSTAIAVGGDFVVGETHVHSAAEEFVLYDLASIPAESAPRSAPALAARVRVQRVLVLAGNYEDKPLVARHVAARLARDAVSAPPELLEWGGGPDLDSLLRGLRRRKAPAVVMLPRIEPRQVDWRLSRLRDETVALGHFVVATTDLPAATWHLGGEDRGFWHELAEDDLFDPAKLVTALIDELERVRETLPARLLAEDEAAAELSKLRGVTLREIAGRLRTPANVSMFVDLLAQCAAAGEVDAAAVERLLQEVTSPRRRVEKWFEAQDADAQLLVLGLSLFEGLADDQFFAALERWVAHIRANRDPRLRAFDYSDAARLEGFFQPVVTEGRSIRYEPRWPGQRRFVFSAAWKSHRRQLLNALSVLTGLAAESADGRGTDLELYGSPARRWQIRRAATEALGEMGLLSAEAVEPALLRLASDEDLDVQEVAASAAALWRRHGEDEQFFALLRRWQRDSRIRAVVESLLTGRGERRNFGPQAQIRSTIALAVGVAAGYDPPNQLRPELVTVLQELAADPNELVRERFASFTLPQVVALHLEQLRGTLHGLARYVGLTHAIGAALAYAARTVPEGVVATLNAWHAECARSRPATVDPRRVTRRDALLMVLAFTYGELTYDDGGPLTADAGFARLKEILAREAHPRVRSAVVIAMSRQAAKRFARVEPMLQQLVEEVTPEERDEVVRLLTDVYLDQRRALGEGDGTFERGGKRYPIWIGRARPLTDVEGAMMRWLGDAQHPAAQRIAVQATLSFVEALDGAETSEAARRHAERLRRAEEDDDRRIDGTPVHVAVRSGWYTGWLVPWLATHSEPELFPVIRGLLPEALAQNTSRPVTLNFTLGRWEAMEGNDATTAIARRLRSAMVWQTGAWWLLGVALLLVVFVLVKIL